MPASTARLTTLSSMSPKNAFTSPAAAHLYRNVPGEPGSKDDPAAFIGRVVGVVMALTRCSERRPCRRARTAAALLRCAPSRQGGREDGRFPRPARAKAERPRPATARRVVPYAPPLAAR